MTLTPQNTSWIDNVPEPRKQTSNVAMQPRVKFEGFWRIDATFTIGHAQLYHFPNDPDGTHKDPCYVLAAINFNKDAVDEELLEWSDPDQDTWIVSAAGIDLAHAIMRILHGVDREPHHDNQPTDAQAALLRMRGKWQTGQLPEMIGLFALGGAKKRMVCYLDRGHDFFEPSLLGHGFSIEPEQGDTPRVRYYKEI